MKKCCFLFVSLLFLYGLAPAQTAPHLALGAMPEFPAALRGERFQDGGWTFSLAFSNGKNPGAGFGVRTFFHYSFTNAGVLSAEHPDKDYHGLPAWSFGLMPGWGVAFPMDNPKLHFVLSASAGIGIVHCPREDYIYPTSLISRIDLSPADAPAFEAALGGSISRQLKNMQYLDILFGIRTELAGELSRTWETEGLLPDKTSTWDYLFFGIGVDYAFDLTSKPNL